jgi:monofunctional biosynthetic peptidoglycan transglycosylase
VGKNKSGNGTKSPWRKRILLSIVLVIVFALSIYILIQLSLPDIGSLINNNPPTTALIEHRKEEAKVAGEKIKIRQQWVSFNKIPKLLKRTIRISEDANFYFHRGIDLDELQESIKKNWEKGEFARGASTITQQLAKNIFLSTEKSIWRKVREFFITREIESTLSKNRIFHLYLNIIEYGRGIFGVAAASRYYFGKSVSELNDEEIIRLTAVIPKPLSVNPDRNSKWLLWRCRWITDKLLLYKYIDDTKHDSLMTLFSPPEP